MVGRVEEVRRTIEDVGDERLTFREDEKSIRLEHWRFPIYPYGNYVKHVVELNKEDNTVYLYEVRDSWNGTGRFDEGHVRLEKIEELAERMRKTKNLEDFKDVVDLVKKLINERRKEITKAFDELYLAFVELAETDERFRKFEKMLKNKEVFKEVIQRLEKYIENILMEKP